MWLYAEFTKADHKPSNSKFQAFATKPSRTGASAAEERRGMT